MAAVPAWVWFAASAAASAGSAIQQGQQQKKAAEHQAAIQAQQATSERQVARADESDFRARQRRLMAAGRARGGASGFTSAGTPLLIAEDLAAESELQALRIRHGGEVRGTRLDQQAGLTKFQGRQAAAAGFTRAGASLLSSGSQYFGQ